MHDGIRKAIEARALPTDRAELLEGLMDDELHYSSQEGPIWDFKQEWPFSCSDDYFEGIARLICAFSNTEGGIIVFGVHDEKRTAGCNKTRPNMDKLAKALSQALSDEPQLILHRYDLETPAHIDVLLVPPIGDGALPIRFRRSIKKLPPEIIWIRHGHEVLRADTRHIAMLYCRSSPMHLDADAADLVIGGQLPPTAATIKKFVGRIKTIDQIFRWLKQPDEPRTFLYGKGGSGKTTIAYEIAKVCKSYGARLRIGGTEVLDNVIFVSGKQTMLDTIRAVDIAFDGLDFSDERELYEAILVLGGWTSNDLSNLNVAALKREIEEFLDLTSNFIIIDDIDTLTTKGLEAGFDFLFKCLIRAKRQNKVLYTLRNAPTHSIANSIEVPGLEKGSEYEEFVNLCANQFKVPPPTPGFRDDALVQLSERRPLVVEAIIALRRTTGTYENALSLFSEKAGDNVRRYVFQREWDALPANNNARYCLAILSLNKNPITFEDIVVLTKFTDNQVKDALAEVREMFLDINDVGDTTTYGLGLLTSSFISEASRTLDRYEVLKERFSQFRKNIYPTNPEITRLAFRITGLLGSGRRSSSREDLEVAWSLVDSTNLVPRVTEDPRFLSLRGYVAARQDPPRLNDARRAFADAWAMKFEPSTEHLVAWFYAERNSGHGYDQCLQISQKVSDGRSYSPEDKIDFLSRRGTMLYSRGKNEWFINPEHALNDLSEALAGHLVCYQSGLSINYSKVGKAEEYARNTFFLMLNYLGSVDRIDEAWQRLIAVVEKSTDKKAGESKVKLDPLVNPFLEMPIFIGSIVRKERRDIAHRLLGRAAQLYKVIDAEYLWMDPTIREQVTVALNDVRDRLQNGLDQLSAI